MSGTRGAEMIAKADEDAGMTVDLVYCTGGPNGRLTEDVRVKEGMR